VAFFVFNESFWQTADILDSDLTEAIRFYENIHSFEVSVIYSK
jgi:hypothetical protein